MQNEQNRNLSTTRSGGVYGYSARDIHRNLSTTRSGRVYGYSAREIHNPTQGIANQAGALPNPAQDVQNPAGAVPPRRRLNHLDRPVVFNHPTRVLSEQELAEVLCGICHRIGASMKRCRWPVMETRCGHTFCIPCIGRWRKVSGSCPMCNQPLTGRFLETVFHLA